MFSSNRASFKYHIIYCATRRYNSKLHRVTNAISDLLNVLNTDAIHQLVSVDINSKYYPRFKKKLFYTFNYT